MIVVVTSDILLELGLQMHHLHMCVLRLTFSKLGLLHDGLRGTCSTKIHAIIYIHFLKEMLGFINIWFKQSIRLMLICT